MLSKLCGPKPFRQVVKSDVIPTPGIHLLWGSSESSCCHLCQRHTQMTLKWSSCSGPNNTIALELAAVNCSCLFNTQASWEQRLAFSVFSGSTQCLGCRRYSLLLSHNHHTHSMATSVFHILVNSVTISPRLQVLSILSTNTTLCPQDRKLGAGHWEYRGELDRWFLIPGAGSLMSFYLEVYGQVPLCQSVAKVTTITIRSSAFSSLPELRSSSFLQIWYMEWLVAVLYWSIGVIYLHILATVWWGVNLISPTL